MKFKASDERVKNERVITTRIIERIVVETTIAATPEHPATAKVEQATEIKTMLQELRESINAYVQAQKEENQRFWTYLVHFEAHKHQFARYMKSKHAYFLELLLQ